MKNKSFTPKLFSIIQEGITREQLLKDLLAGIIVGIVALPLAIAFAIASGVSPEKGIVTAIIAGIIISSLGGSRVQIGGPTGAFIVIVYSIVQDYGIEGLTISTFIAGFILIGFGFAKLGNLLKYIPYPLIVGFTSGIAVIIFSSQIKDFLGLEIDKVPADFIQKWKVYGLNLQSLNLYSVGIALITVILSLKFHKVVKKIPGSLVAILLSTIVVQVLKLPVDTIESSFGEIPNSFSPPSLPHFNFETIQALIQPAFAIALLGGIESLLSAVVADGMIGGHHRSNMELVAQGTANCFSALFGGIPATGAIARTATNVKNGGRTPLAGIIHSLILLAIMLLFAPYAKLIPMSCLAGILMVVAYHMSEWRQFKSLLKSNRLDVLVMLVTFFLTVFFDLIIAIEVGIVLSAFILMKRMSDSIKVQSANDLMEEQNGKYDKLFEEELLQIPKGVILYEISGALFFGASQQFQDTILNLHYKPRILILRMRNVPFIDATGVYRLKELVKRFNDRKVKVILSGVNHEVQDELNRSNIFEVLDRENVLNNIEASINRAKEILLKSEKINWQ